MTDLTGRVVAVTGASSGIGAATAVALAEKGAKVVVGARRLDRLEGLVSRFGSDSVRAVETDVRSAAAVQHLVDEGVSAFGRLDAMVANAGLGHYGGILDLDDDECVEMVETNVLGTVWSVRAALPALLEAGGGDIVIVASVAGLRGDANEAVYAATKFAQVGLAGAVDREMRTRKIRVSTVCPAAVSTEFAIGFGRTEGAEWLDDVLRPEDVAHAIVTILEQPAHVRTTQWAMWSMAQGS